MTLKSKLLSIFGDIKLCPYPPFLYYQKGDYYEVTGEDTEKVIKEALPGDILCRGYKSYVDNYFIPGEYSHSGVYIGDCRVIHAVAEGVVECSLIDFARCDRLIVLRSIEPSRRVRAVQRVKSWLNKPYDFNFSEGDDAFYCHELSAKAYRECGIVKLLPYLGVIRMVSMEPKYLAESFLINPLFITVLEFNRSKK